MSQKWNFDAENLLLIYTAWENWKSNAGANIDGDVNDVGYPLIQASLYVHLCVVLYSSVFDFNKGAHVMILQN